MLPFLTIAACALLPPSLDDIRTQATAQGFQERTYTFDGMQILSFERLRDPKDRILHVFIEGDGLAWRRKYVASNNPTPKDPVSFNMMLAAEEPFPNRLYLARPCQYLEFEGCEPSLWTSQRFSPEIVHIYVKILEAIAAAHPGYEILLHGYSGGGTLALLIAAHAPNLPLIEIATYASPLDTEAWTRYHGVSPLAGSLNPKDFGAQITTPQVHECGLNDDVVPCRLHEQALHFYPEGDLARTDNSHQCCWEKTYDPEELRIPDLKNESAAAQRK